MHLLWPFLVFVILTLDPNQESLVCSFDQFGKVCSLGEFYDPLDSGGLGIILIDCDGQLLPISMGRTKAPTHSGFLLGALSPRSPKSIRVEIGSTEEEVLVSKIWDYLVMVFGSEENARIATVAGEAKISEDRKRAAYLVRMVLGFERNARTRDWLNRHFSKTEQDRIINSDYADLGTELEKEAFCKICGLQNRPLIQRARDPEHEVWCN